MARTRYWIVFGFKCTIGKKLKSQKSPYIINYFSSKQDSSKANPGELFCCRSSLMRLALRQKYENISSAHGLI